MSQNGTKRRGPKPKYDWQSADWAEENNKDIAKRLGCTPQIVSNHRYLHGFPASPHAQARGRGNTAKEDA